MKAIIKRSIKEAFRKAGYHVENVQERRDFLLMYQRAVEALLYERIHRVGPEFFFLQIGANDGVSFDWLYSFVTENRLSGVVVEPLTDFYNELCSNYSKYPFVTPVNVGIHRTAREIEIYRVNPEATGLAAWTKGIASMDPKHHERSGTPSEHMMVEKVQCITMQELLDQHKIERIDYLQIDTEGYDAEILQMIDFKSIKPEVIRFEHQMEIPVMTRQDFKKCFNILHDAGYYVLMDKYDAVAYLP